MQQQNTMGKKEEEEAPKLSKQKTMDVFRAQ